VRYKYVVSEYIYAYIYITRFGNQTIWQKFVSKKREDFLCARERFSSSLLLSFLFFFKYVS
jgi:hypothetical protein